MLKVRQLEAAIIWSLRCSWVVSVDRGPAAVRSCQRSGLQAQQFTTTRRVGAVPWKRSGLLKRLYSAIQPSRTAVAHGLADSKDYEALVRLYQAVDLSLMTTDEIYLRLQALMGSGKFDELREFITEVVGLRNEQISRTLAKRLVPLGLAVNVTTALLVWAEINMRLYGHLDFNGYKLYAAPLGDLEKIADRLKDAGPERLRQLGIKDEFKLNRILTSMMHVAVRKRHYQLLSNCWAAKSRLYRVSLDLTCMLTMYIKTGQYTSAIALYTENSELHEDYQFDKILIALGKTRNWSQLQVLFDGLFGKDQLPSLTQYGIVMYLLAQNGYHSNVFQLHDQILLRKMKPGLFVYLALMKACLLTGSLNGVFKWFLSFLKVDAEAANFGGPSNVRLKQFAYDTLLRSLSQHEKIERALDILAVLEDKQLADQYHYTSVMAGCAEIGDVPNASRLYAMAKKTKLDDKFYHTYMQVYIRAKQYRQAYVIYHEYCKTKAPSVKISCQYLTAAMKLHDTTTVEQIVQEVALGNVEPDIQLLTLLIEYFCSQHNFDLARDIVAQLDRSETKPRQAIYNSLVKNLFKQDQPQDALAAYNTMIEQNIRVNRHTTSHVLKYLILQKHLFQQTSDLLDRMLTTKGLVANATISRYLETYEAQIAPPQLQRILDYLGSQTEADQLGLLRASIIVHGKKQQWPEIEVPFDELLERLLADKLLKNSRIQPGYKYYLNAVLKYKINQAIFDRDLQSFLPQLDKILAAGFRLDNPTVNRLLVIFFSHDELVEYGLGFASGEMVNNYIYLRQRRKSRLDNQHDLTSGPMQGIGSDKIYITHATLANLKTLFRSYRDRMLDTDALGRLRALYPGAVNLLLGKGNGQ